MSKSEKLLSKMRNNQKNWRIDDLRKVFNQYGFIEGSSNGGSHISFSHPNLEEILTVPVHKPIKAIYVKQLIEKIDYLEENYDA